MTEPRRLCACGCPKLVSRKTEYRHLRALMVKQLVRSSKAHFRSFFRPHRRSTTIIPTGHQGPPDVPVSPQAPEGPSTPAPGTVPGPLSPTASVTSGRSDVSMVSLDSFGGATAPGPMNGEPHTPRAAVEATHNPDNVVVRRSSRLAAISQRRWGSGTPAQLSSNFDEMDPIPEDEEDDPEPAQPEIRAYDYDEDDDCGLEEYLDNLHAMTLLSEDFLREFASAGGDYLDRTDINLLRAYTLKVEEHLTNRTYEKFRFAFPDASLGTIKETESRVHFLSGIQPIRYDCCQSSCICYVGPYKDLDQCPQCKANRFGSDGRPCAFFEYYPIIPRLRAMAADPTTATAMQYRSTYNNDEPNSVGDVFDGSHYRSLKETLVSIGDDTLPLFYFSDPRDVALGISTDGFGPFRKRSKTCWPIILFNYNLPPETRFHRKNIIVVGVIPGPKKPGDMDSFLWALVEECVELAYGVSAFDAIRKEAFELRAYPILGFGDIPAISLVIRMKGQNALRPCRMCEIPGIKGPDTRTLYVPLHRSNLPGSPTSYDPRNLPLRSHHRFLQQAEEIENTRTATDSEKLQTQYGIKGVPVLSSLGSLSFPISFPYDFMHLIWSNLLPNLILFWTASFKEVDHRTQPYVIDEDIWKAIGAAGKAAGKTIPAAFGCRVPDLSKDNVTRTAEAHSIWTLYLAPALLRGRFIEEQYYKHFIDLVGLLNSCLKYNLKDTEIDDLEAGFIRWVEDYERLYYQHKPERISCCPLTIHSLLHIAPSIRTMGPVWAYWAFPMERLCNELLPHIGSRRYPYKSLNKYVGARAHLSQIKLLYHLHKELDLLPASLHAHEFRHPNYPGWALLYPVRTGEELPQDLRHKLIASLATRYETTFSRINRILPPRHVFRVCLYGRARQIDGDTMHARDMISDHPDSRDMSFVRYDLAVDVHAHNRRRAPQYELRTFFGQVKYFFVMEMPAASDLAIPKQTLVYAAIRQVIVSEALPAPNRISFYETEGPLDIVDINSVQAVIGRIRVDNRWAIIDRQEAIASTHVL